VKNIAFPIDERQWHPSLILFLEDGMYSRVVDIARVAESDVENLEIEKPKISSAVKRRSPNLCTGERSESQICLRI